MFSYTTKFLYLPCILSAILTLLSVYFFNKKIVPATKSDETIELYYEISIQFAKVGSLVFNVCCSIFFSYICYIGGYFLRFSRRSYRFHSWLSVFTLLILIFTTIFMFVTSGGLFTNIELLLSINALQCILFIGLMWEQRVQFEAFIQKATKENRQTGRMPIQAQMFCPLNVPEKPSNCQTVNC